MEGVPCEPRRVSGLETKATGPDHSSEVVVEDSTISVPFPEPLGFILKMPASLQPVCLVGSPVTLPVEVQLAGGVEPQTPTCLALPLIFDWPHTQHSSPVTEQQNLLYSLHQNNGFSQNLSQIGEEKSKLSENTTTHSSEFVAAVQELFPFLRNSSAFPFNNFSTGFLPSFYTGSFVSQLPPATLLVPFPLVVPFPVPLPIPIPIPFSDSLSRAHNTMKTSKSTQTMTEDIPLCTHNTTSSYGFPQLPTQPAPPVPQEQVLDLRVKVAPIQTKQEVQDSFHQDNVLDLSPANKSCLETGKDAKLKHHGGNSKNVKMTKSILPIKCLQTQVNGYSDVEYSMQYKWTTKERYENDGSKYSEQNGRVITPKQIPRATLSSKDSSAMFCEKLIRPPQGHVLKKQKRVNSQNINIPPIKKKQHLKIFPSTI